MLDRAEKIPSTGGATTRDVLGKEEQGRKEGPLPSFISAECWVLICFLWEEIYERLRP